jgi:hypothetical protein
MLNLHGYKKNKVPEHLGFRIQIKNMFNFTKNIKITFIINILL